MKILQISSATTPGGGGKRLEGLVAGLAARKHEVHIAVRRGSPLAEASSEEVAGVLTLPLRNAFDIASGTALSDYVHKNKIKIVHAHLARDYPLAKMAVGKSRTKLVLTRHVLFPLSQAHKETCRRVSAMIAVSQATADALKAQSICDPKKIRIIRNGIDASLYNGSGESEGRNGFRQRLGLTNKDMLIGAAGELRAVKGYKCLIEAFVLLLKQLPQSHLLIASSGGPRAEIHEATLRGAAEKLDGKDRVHFHDSVADMPEFMGALDLFVSASQSEASGLLLMEAMASNRAVVAAETEGAAELIKDQHDGTLVPVGDPEKMAGAIADLLSSPEKRKNYGEHAREKILRSYTLDRMVDETEKLYKEITEPGATGKLKLPELKGVSRRPKGTRKQPARAG